MLDIGRLCIKTAGKDAGKTVVVVDTIDDTFVTIDGPVKRKRCNIQHLEPMSQLLKIKKNASHGDIVKEFKLLKIDILEKKAKKQKAPKPQQQRIQKKQPATEKPKETKKEEVKQKKETKKPVKKSSKK